MPIALMKQADHPVANRIYIKTNLNIMMYKVKRNIIVFLIISTLIGTFEVVCLLDYTQYSVLDTLFPLSSAFYV